MKILLLIISIIFIFFGCSSDNSERSSNSIDGTWFSECVDVNLLPFPMYSVFWEGYIIMELNFDNGNFYSVSHVFLDDQCQTVESEYTSLEGTYVIVDDGDLQPSGRVTQLDMELIDVSFSIDLGSITSYYLIEGGHLFMNDTFSSFNGEVNINRDISFTKEN